MADQYYVSPGDGGSLMNVTDRIESERETASMYRAALESIWKFQATNKDLLDPYEQIVRHARMVARHALDWKKKD